MNYGVIPLYFSREKQHIGLPFLGILKVGYKGHLNENLSFQTESLLLCVVSHRRTAREAAKLYPLLTGGGDRWGLCGLRFTDLFSQLSAALVAAEGMPGRRLCPSTRHRLGELEPGPGSVTSVNWIYLLSLAGHKLSDSPRPGMCFSRSHLAQALLPTLFSQSRVCRDFPLIISAITIIWVSVHLAQGVQG